MDELPSQGREGLNLMNPGSLAPAGHMPSSHTLATILQIAR